MDTQYDYHRVETNGQSGLFLAFQAPNLRLGPGVASADSHKTEGRRSLDMTKKTFN